MGGKEKDMGDNVSEIYNNIINRETNPKLLARATRGLSAFRLRFENSRGELERRTTRGREREREKERDFFNPVRRKRARRGGIVRIREEPAGRRASGRCGFPPLRGRGGGRLCMRHKLKVRMSPVIYALVDDEPDERAVYCPFALLVPLRARIIPLEFRARSPTPLAIASLFIPLSSFLTFLRALFLRFGRRAPFRVHKNHRTRFTHTHTHSLSLSLSRSLARSRDSAFQCGESDL